MKNQKTNNQEVETAIDSVVLQQPSKKITKKELLNRDHTQHVKNLQNYYRGGASEDPNILGIVRDNPDLDFRWTATNHPKDVHRVQKREQIGWANAENVELEISHRSKDASPDGGSIFTQDLGGGLRAILQCIPKELNALNQRAKSKLAKTHRLVDDEGHVIDTSVLGETKEKIRRHKGWTNIETQNESPEIKL